ncbi:MAG TPA: MerR family transcriptional regulator [Terriglobales bacterium]|nr:MerR family transcriptional regulator [Terriglobales bacterium]
MGNGTRQWMAYTVKQLAVMSGVTVRTLHFYDEMALLKPAYTTATGYRMYEEPQLLLLQQILFYRELGFELKRINEILSQREFEKLAALESHRLVLEQNLTRTRTLIETIDKTISHLKGAREMKSEEMFKGFNVGAGKDRFNAGFTRHGTTIDCKVSGKDTAGAMCVFEVNNTGWPRHVNRDQDEWIYVLDGEVELEIRNKRLRLGARESMFIPRNIEHTWATVSPATKIINTYQPAGKIEGFFQVLAKFKDLPTREQAIEKSYTAKQKDGLKRVFEAHGMIVTGPPLDVDSNGK